MSIREEIYSLNISIRRKKQLKSLNKFLFSILTNNSTYILSAILVIISVIVWIKTISTISYNYTPIILNFTDKLIINEEPIKINEYIVKKGETIITISKKLGVSISTLVSLNNLSSQTLKPGSKLIYTEKDSIKYHSAKKFSVFDVSKKYKIHPYEIFVANGYRFDFDKECIVPGIQMSWREISEKLGIGFLKPVFGRISSKFGYRIHPVLGIKKFHSGLDISAPYGSPVKSSMSGIVEKTGYDENGYGYFIVIKHGNSTKTLYGHLSQILVKEGQRVNRGQTIGKVGDTGMTTGPHLHFEVIKNGTKVNPKKYITR